MPRSAPSIGAPSAEGAGIDVRVLLVTMSGAQK
jgi:hypothetical protein